MKESTMNFLLLLLSTCFFNHVLAKNFGGIPMEPRGVGYLSVRDNSDGEGFYTGDDVYYVPENIDAKNGVGDREINTGDVMNYADVEKVNKLKELNNTSTFQKVRKTFYESKSNDTRLGKHVKEILSVALNIPVQEINIHDIELLLKRWRYINKGKKFANKGNNEEKYFKSVKKHGTYQTVTDQSKGEDDYMETVPPDNNENKAKFISITYLTELFS
ncbi:conserved Plasmodium protein, unknown function [Plasmodium ovale]|uniref:Fam-a protein n=2 Tax=Plasmodium ovale TaxID=36330 RepID=A0A1C3KRQ6_PLAOA|nr:conserved Plasmodium protein, unknown function [Plasmodium ovale]